ncbi:sigma-70 family RNA polymerase sigma factor [Thermoclostridium caenicola]|uniref:RNA polymerase sigma-70 factor, ECF subfamily n=2 Tax=Thermoclostridium caenicola TaxID=659425 RepID=A0A1M6G7V1_9FIRM|nr:sigma-70 family RNA polymerase sigma factor [Thermoclostridium caenicola]SHJ06012.1 RNA polymerase sigma-70 factor, ECF subfamily [Thermoclostridium caenicola]HOP73365.1 sigma-70 family RNA polymerase sigma factor [Thermoclostridium caenicola]HPU22447.1 sigma-70 family RNA polymerase sigma factor [Thermoclostridium caenicola]
MAPSEKMNEITRLVEQYGDDVMRTAYVMLKSKELAEDAYQETFLRLCRYYDSYRKECSEKTWITGIVINVCRDFLRSAWKKRVTVTDDFSAQISESDTQEIVEKKDEKEELLRSIMKLPDKYREMIHLYYYQELDIKEISRILKIPGGTVKSRLFKARNLLAGMLGGEANG